jgi:hypothetical protein
MKKLIVLTLFFMAFGIYEAKRPQKVKIEVDAPMKYEHVKEEIGRLRAELDQIERAIAALQVD